jgi:hypothetical protein
MKVSGYERWSAAELRDVLGGDVPIGDVNALHGALMVLCVRISELEARLKAVEATVGSAGPLKGGNDD